MDVELTKDEQELLLFIDAKCDQGNYVGKGESFLRDILKFQRVDKPEDILESLMKKQIVGAYRAWRGGPFIYHLTEKGKEAIEWM